MSAICLSHAREEGSMDVKEQRRAALATMVLVAVAITVAVAVAYWFGHVLRAAGF